MKEKKLKKAKRAKNRPRFRVMDAVIILLVITSALGIYFRYNLFETLKNQRNIKEYVVSFTISNIRQSTVSYLDIDDVVYDGESGEKIGVLIEHSPDASSALSPLPASEYFVDKNGNVQKADYPYTEGDPEVRVSPTGRLRCEGTFSDASGFHINGSQYIAPGQTIQVQTETVTFLMTVTEIAPLE